MKTLPVKTQTVDLETGASVDSVSEFLIVPPDLDACQVCGRLPAHDADQPHDAQSLYYQYAFYGEHGRWPTWKDALEHCSEPVRRLWEAELRRRGAWSQP